MARKTTNICAIMLGRHDDHRLSILIDTKTTDREKVLLLRAINSMMEDLLHKSNCYHGFQHTDTEAFKKVMEQYESTPGADYTEVVLDSVAENSRMYHGLRSW